MKSYYYFYSFTDGYFCYYAGKMTRIEKQHEELRHGKIVVEKKVFY